MVRDCGRYIVIKRADVARYLSHSDERALSRILGVIQKERVVDGKAPYHDYICVRQDAPYAEMVWRMIEAHKEHRCMDMHCGNCPRLGNDPLCPWTQELMSAAPREEVQ